MKPHRVSIACATALALTLGLSLAQPAHAHRIRPPAVPSGLEPDEGSVAFFVGHAVGTQNYICLPSGASFAWVLYTPEATLFDRKDKQLTTHFFSPNPLEAGTFRPTWQHSRDTSAVWAKLNTGSSDAAYVESGALAWLLLDVAGAAAGPRGGDALAKTTQIQRVNTRGGLAPATGCSASTDVGGRAFVPYTADYYFYTRPAGDEEDED